MNYVKMSGVLKGKPYVNEFQSGKLVNFLLDCEGEDGRHAFVTCNVWNNSEFKGAEKLKQGDKFSFEGHVQVSSYVNKAGKKVYSTTIVVDKELK